MFGGLRLFQTSNSIALYMCVCRPKQIDMYKEIPTLMINEDSSWHHAKMHFYVRLQVHNRSRQKDAVHLSGCTSVQEVI